MKYPEKIEDLTQEVYEEMLGRVEWLDCLQAAGVDNWEGYDHAIDILTEEMIKGIKVE